MRTDILPLCDHHYRAMEPSSAPFSADCPEPACAETGSQTIEKGRTVESPR